MNWTYVAGVFDGSGAVRLTASGAGQLAFWSDNVAFLELLQLFLGCGSRIARGLLVSGRPNVLWVASHMRPFAITKAYELDAILARAVVTRRRVLKRASSVPQAVEPTPADMETWWIQPDVLVAKLKALIGEEAAP